MTSSLLGASSVLPATSSTNHSPRRHSRGGSLSFRLSSKPKLLLPSYKGSRSKWSRVAVPKAQLNEVTVDGSSNASATTPTESEVLETPRQELKSESASSLSEASISEFMNQVASLVKLVDSRDIVELQLKQPDCEITIRKKEALPQPPAPAPVVMMQSPSLPAPSPYPPAQAPTASLPPVSAPAVSSARKAAKSSLPPLKCPMAGTFYRSAAPGEPPFVKVGDQVKKGQVLCIIEAMKLMNEIEADQSGKIVEILAEDGKPVSVDAPLFVIEP